MNDFDLYLRCREPIRRVTERLFQTISNPAVTSDNPAFVIFERGDGNRGDQQLHRRRMVAIGANGPSDPREEESADHPENDDSEARTRFVQFAIDPTGITLDQPTSTLDICDGERLIRERTGYRIDRRMGSLSRGGTMFFESILRDFPCSEYRDHAALCMAVSVEAAWILYDLFAVDPGEDLHVTAFTRNGAILAWKKARLLPESSKDGPS